MTSISAPIGVFDSGIGGLSILKALQLAMPAERFVYFADTKYSPYGVKSQEFVRERSLCIVQTLMNEHQIKALVVACNTATAAAVCELRAQWPLLPIVGVEPALKPAALATRTGRVRVLATRGTLLSEKFAQLISKLEAKHAARSNANTSGLHFTCVPCDGLAERIEQLAASGKPWQEAPDLIALCAGFMPAISSFGLKISHKNEVFDTLVLGCTHYQLIRDVFASLAGNAVTIIDNAGPVAQRTLQLIADLRAPSDQVAGVVWRSSADVAQLVQAAQFWGFEAV